METCESCGSQVSIDTKTNEYVCLCCGLVQDVRLFKNEFEPFYPEEEYEKEVFNTPSYINGSKIILSKFNSNRKMRALQKNNTLNAKVDKFGLSVLDILDKWDCEFNFNYNTKYTVKQIACKIKSYIKHELHNIPAVVITAIAVLYYYRLHKIPIIHCKSFSNKPISLSIPHLLNIINYIEDKYIRPRAILSIITLLPEDFVKKFLMVKKRPYIFSLIEKIFQSDTIINKFIKKGVAIDNIKTYLLKECLAFIDKHNTINSVNNFDYCLKVIYDLTENYRKKGGINSRILYYEDLARTFEISSFTIRNVRLDDRNSVI